MTREEAIYELKNAAWLGTDHSRARTEEAVNMAIQALSQEPCTDAVSREAVLNEFYDVENLYERIKQLPSVTPTCEEREKESVRIMQDDAISREAVLDAVSEGCLEFRGIYGRCEELINALPHVTQKSGKWIPVSEKLPKVGISVLVCDIEDDIYLTHLTRYGRFFDDSGNFIKNIVAWMTLPEPYEPQESEVRNETTD